MGYMTWMPVYCGENERYIYMCKASKDEKHRSDVR